MEVCNATPASFLEIKDELLPMRGFFEQAQAALGGLSQKIAEDGSGDAPDNLLLNQGKMALGTLLDFLDGNFSSFSYEKVLAEGVLSALDILQTYFSEGMDPEQYKRAVDLISQISESSIGNSDTGKLKIDI